MRPRSIKRSVKANSMNRTLPLIILVITMLGYSSCGLLKHGRRSMASASDSAIVLADTTKPAFPVVPPAPMPYDTAAMLRAANESLIAQYRYLWTRRIDYKTFSGKARVHIETPDGSNDFAAHFRIRKDSVIWVSVNLAGIPVARVFITRDSIFMIDYYHKEAKIQPLNQIAKILPTEVSFSSLQNLVLGEPLSDGAITSATPSGDSVAMQVEDSNYVQQFVFNLADSSMRNAHLATRSPAGPHAFSEYSMYEVDNGRRIATNRAVNVQNNNAIYILEMYFSKMEFDEPQEYPFSIPKSYRE